MIPLGSHLKTNHTPCVNVSALSIKILAEKKSGDKGHTNKVWSTGFLIVTDPYKKSINVLWFVKINEWEEIVRFLVVWLLLDMISIPCWTQQFLVVLVLNSAHPTFFHFSFLEILKKGELVIFYKKCRKLTE